MTDSHVAREEALLGCVLLDNAQLARIQVSPDDFVSRAHAQMFEMIRRRIGLGQVTDAVTVAEALEAETGRREWLTPLARMVMETAAPANAPAYADIVRKSSIARQAKSVAVALAQDADGDLSDAIDAAIRSLMDLTRQRQEYACHQADAITAAMDEIDAAHSGAGGVRSGIKTLDDCLGGFHREDLIVIAGRPAMGKTAVMLNISAAADVPVGIISGEQGRAQIGMRLLSINGGLSLHRMRLGTLGDDEWARISAVFAKVRHRPVFLFDKPAPTIEDIVRQARAWKFDCDLGLLMVDYLQKIRGGEGKDKRLQVGDIAARLKDLGRELKIPIVALSQISRDVEKRPLGNDGLGRMPYMSDVSESGIIEQEADQVITLYRPSVYDDQPRFAGLAYINICKNRHGPVGHRQLVWRAESLQFGDLAQHEMLAHDQWSAA